MAPREPARVEGEGWHGDAHCAGDPARPARLPVADDAGRSRDRRRPRARAFGLRVGSWAPLAKAPRYEYDSVHKVAAGRKAVALALRVARFAGVPMGELLAGQWLSSRVCPHCRYPPEYFVDEETMVE